MSRDYPRDARAEYLEQGRKPGLVDKVTSKLEAQRRALQDQRLVKRK